MVVRRVVPDIRTTAMAESRAFYVRLGLVEVMDLGWVVTLASPTHPTAQVTLSTADATADVVPDLTIEVDDVDAAHDAMVAAGATIRHTLRDEEWGVRRFFVEDPSGRVVNVVAHR